jgi:hypothetical protein
LVDNRISEKQKYMSERMFDPSNAQYKKVENLPKEEQANFANIEKNRFVRKEAKEEFDNAQKIVELANQFKEAGIDVKQLLDKRRSPGMLKEIGQALKDDKTAMDILQERAEAEILKPVDVLQEEANEIHRRKYPEKSYLERLRINPDDLTGIPRSIWSNKKFAMEAVRLNSKALRKVRVYDKEIALEAVKHDGLILQYAYGYRSDKDVVLEAVKQNPNAIRFASKDIKEAISKLL